MLALRPGDRRALPRMPMVALHEPIGKKLLLSPLRATGATIAGVGHLTMAVGKGVTWVGDKIRVPRREEDRYIEEPEAVEVVRRWRAGKQEREAAGKKGGGLGVRTRILRMVTGHYVCTGEGKCCDRKDMPIPDEKKKVSAGEKKLVIEEDFKIFNEKGEKTWSKDVDVEVVSTATTTRADSLVVGDEKCVKEFC